jgi:hypothetical protein
VADARLLSLRFPGTCILCDAALSAGSRAWWFKEKKGVVCTDCRPPADDPKLSSVEEKLIALGEAGASAQREANRRMRKREEQIRAQHPRIGNLILAATSEPQSTRSWSTGAAGERSLGARLDEIASERLVVMHDRRLPRSRVNIDHLVVNASGVYLIDAKHYAGRVEKQEVGGWFDRDVRLRVGGRNCTKLVHAAGDQAETVGRVISQHGFEGVPVRAVLCFIGAEWGLFASPFSIGQVFITWPKELYKTLTRKGERSTEAIQELARVLSLALPAA